MSLVLEELLTVMVFMHSLPLLKSDPAYLTQQELHTVWRGYSLTTCPTDATSSLHKL